MKLFEEEVSFLSQPRRVTEYCFGRPLDLDQSHLEALPYY